MLKIKVIYYTSLVFLLGLQSIQLNAQQSNKPSTTVTVTPTVNSKPANYSGNVSYVRTLEARIPITDANALIGGGYNNVNQTTQYIDGLGRPVQTVSRQYSPQMKDIVAPVVYDAFGRETVKYSPYASTATSGLFTSNPFEAQEAFMQVQHPDEKVYYSQTNYEASPLDRVVKAMAPGNSWAGSNRGVSKEYLVNTVAETVRIWKINSDDLLYGSKNDKVNIPYQPANVVYAAGELHKRVITDETGNVIIEYKDKQGRVVLKKVQVSDQIGTPVDAYKGFLCTYYVYDDFNRLRFVIPPKAVEQLVANNWQFTVPMINELCFRYEYDDHRRLIAKKAPGVDWLYMVYDVRDRLIFTQDGNKYGTGQWMATLYDALNRPVMTGMMVNYTGNRDALQQDVDRQTAGNVAEATVAGMLINKYPVPSTASFVALTKTHYDNYGWTGISYDPTYSTKLDAGNNTHAVTWPATIYLATQGLTTGIETRVLADINNLAANRWLVSVNFYDDHGRVIQEYSETLKGTDVTSHLFDFTGNLLCTYLDHANTAGTPTSLHVKTNMEYDHADRLTEVWKTINDDPGKKVLIVKNEYDELGLLKYRKLGHKRDISGNYTPGIEDPVEVMDYTHNIRGWMTGINKDYANGKNVVTGSDPWFGMELSYDQGFQISQYNGNIAGTKWRSKSDGAQRAYGYTYDKANRLMGADFSQLDGGNYIDHPVVQFDVQMGDGTDPFSAYDANGNIKALKQWGLKLNNSQVIDDLEYRFFDDGNKVKTIADKVQPQTATGLGDFTDNNTNGDDYGFDRNGNLITDKNKKLVGNTGVDQTGGAIIYNHLNLPWKMNVTDGALKGTITYVYDASGIKLQKITFEPGVTVTYSGNQLITDITTTTNYSNGMVYVTKEYTNSNLSSLAYTDRLQMIPHEEGRIRYTPAVGTEEARFEFDYFVKDNLGNVRMVLTEQPKQDIYPAATLEGDLATQTDAVYVEGQFYNINGNYIVQANTVSGLDVYQNSNGSTPVNNNPNSNTGANSEKVYRLHAATNKTGLGIALKVMAGDQIDIFGKSYWINTGGNFSDKYPIPVSSILGAFLTTPVMAAKGLTAAGVSSPDLTGALELFRNRNDNAAAPWAYINWIFFDEQYNYAGGGFDRVGTNGIGKDHNNSTIPTIKAPKNGYVFVYCSNESQQNVYFDNLQVIHTRGALLEETHYYPWGLTMSGISSKAAGTFQNKWQFLGKELQNEEFSDGSGLDMYDLAARFYDPQTGRFMQVDPLTEYMRRWSPYAYAFDNPVRYTDVDGMSPVDTTGGAFLNRDGSVQVKELESVTVNAEKKSSNDTGWLHGVLDVVGMIDPTGIADGLNAVIYLAEGNYKDAALSAIGMLPLGDIAKGLKYVDEVEEVAEGIIKYSDEAVEVAEKNIVSHTRVPCGCFLAGTLVLTDSSYIPIEKIKPGDKVWAYNDTTHTFALKQVLHLYQYIRDTAYQVQVGTEVINATSDHPFFIGGRWLRVKQLHVGDSITTYNGGKIAITAINIVVQRTVVYNFEVADYHTYYVSQRQVLVHNSGPCEVKLPDALVLKQDGVTIEHYYHGIDHGPAHLHVSGKGGKTKIGQNGKPLDGSAELSARQQRVVDANKAKIRSTVKKIMRYHRNNNAKK